MKLKYKISIGAIIAIGVIAYLTIPFAKLEQLRGFGFGMNPWDSGKFINRVVAYTNFIYVHKGASFNDLPCYSDDGRDYKVNIKYNWNNTINISENGKNITLHADSIHFESVLTYGFLSDYRDKDLYFESIAFYDTSQVHDSIPYSVTLFRQTSALRNGPQRYGFRLFVNKHKLSTGNKTNEHVFEY